MPSGLSFCPSGSPDDEIFIGPAVNTSQLLGSEVSFTDVICPRHRSSGFRIKMSAIFQVFQVQKCQKIEFESHKVRELIKKVSEKSHDVNFKKSSISHRNSFFRLTGRFDARISVLF